MTVDDGFRRSLESLGLGEYYNGFVAEAFDSWEVLAQITEQDLIALGVRLGHRRILQRAIAERQQESTRPSSAVQQQFGWSSSPVNGSLPPRVNGTQQLPRTATRMKRKYTRHPKNDPNAPVKPPTAYVLYSNYRRESGLQAQGYGFEEIAKIVGADWQEISTIEKNTFLDRAKNQKLDWDRQMAEYKKTPQYAEYQAYLKDFKEKHRAPHARRLTTPAQRSSESSSTDGQFDESSVQTENVDDGYTTRGYGSSETSEASHSRKPSLHTLAPMQSPISDRSPVTIASLPSSAGGQAIFALVNQGRDQRPILAPAPAMESRSNFNTHVRLDRQLPLPIPSFRQ